VLGYLRHMADTGEDGNPNPDAVPNDLMYNISFPAKNGRLAFLCEGRMVAMWAAFADTGESSPRPSPYTGGLEYRGRRGAVGLGYRLTV
jgi:hypothetical protein